MKKYLTTPIYYVNDVPHIGHAYCTLATDTLARYWREKLGKENVFFLTGTDENSQKTVDAAKKSGKPIPEYLEEIAGNWRTTWDEIGIDYDDFIRTTEKRHHDTVHKILQKIYDNGDIYQGKYKGYYCDGCESFLKESDLNDEKQCPDHLKIPRIIEEDNYFFKLSKYEDKLLEIYAKNPELLEPQKRRNEVLSFIKGGLDDVSISRESAEMGIPLPWDDNHKIYVWFDALINYYTGIDTDEKRDFWNYSCHILGKDITRFHNVIWPAMLLSAGIEIPQEEFAHGFFTIDGVKMSKSLGNMVSPLEISREFGNDALRLGLLSSFEFGNDGDFSHENLAKFYDKKMASGLGNLFNRVVVLVTKFLDGNKPDGISAEKTQEEYAKFAGFMEEKKLKSAIDFFFQVVDSANELLNEKEPWKLVKTDMEAAKIVFAELLQKLETLKLMAKILLPKTYPRIVEMLGDTEKVGESQILFARIEKK